MSEKRKPIAVERYLEVRSAAGAAFSADDTTMFFSSNITGMPQVWALDKGTPWPRQFTFFTDRVMGAVPSPTGRDVVIASDVGGSENAQLFLTDLDGVQVRNLTNNNRFIYSFGSWSPDGSCFSYASNQRNGRNFDVYIYDLASDTHRLVHTSDYTNYAGRFTPDGKQLVVSRHYSSVDADLFLIDLASPPDADARLLTPHHGDVRYRGIQFSKDGQFAYLLTDRDSEFFRLVRLNLETLESTFVTEDNWDTDGFSISKDGKLLALLRNVDGQSELEVLDIEADPLGATALPGLPALPAGVISDLSWQRNAPVLALSISSPRYANEIWELHLREKTVTRLTYASISGVPSESFVEPELVHYSSFDGLEVPAFYFRPQSAGGQNASGESGIEGPGGDGMSGEKAEPLPVIVYVHGGPESQSRNSFNSIIQYFVNEGFAVFVPNVRGSSGYGRTYEHLDDVRKRMDSVADLAYGVSWLVDRGGADENAIAVMGGSYGGFMVLASVTHYPNLWAAGVDIVGIANLRSFMENTSPYRRHLRESEYGTIEDDGEFFDQISPIHHVDKINAPMIVIHGANDPRVPVGEAEQIVAALNKRGMPVQYLRFEDEGHGVVKLNNRIVAYGAIADFLKTNLLASPR